MDKSLVSRTWSGLLFVAVLSGAILGHPWVSGVLFLLLGAGTLHEFYHVWLPEPTRWRMLAMLPGLTALCVALGVMLDLLPPLCFALLVPVTIGLMIALIYSCLENPLRFMAVTWWGVVYIAVPFALLMHLRILGGSGLLLGFFFLVWANDSAAYLVGVSLGRHRLMPRISPKKSWEGFWGGVACTVAFSVLVWHLAGSPDLWHWLVMAVLTVVCGVYGDLFESMLKRHAGLKDSGRFMPGHGGLLDRFDAVLTSAPMVWLFLMIC